MEQSHLGKVKDAEIRGRGETGEKSELISGLRGGHRPQGPKQAVKGQRCSAWTHYAKKNFNWFKVRTLNRFGERHLTVKLPLSLCYLAGHQPNQSRQNRWMEFPLWHSGNEPD